MPICIHTQAIHPRRALVVTGQITSHGNPKPPIIVWDPTNVVANALDQTGLGRVKPKAKEERVVLVGFCEERITCVSFSVDGEFVMAIGQDSSHRFACYNWQSGVIIFSGMAGNSDLYMMTSIPAGFAVCGNKEIKVWEHAGLGSTCTTEKEGSRWMCGVAPLGPVRVECITAIHDPGSACGMSIVCGYPDGHILVFAQFKDADKVEWALGYQGARYWMAHSGSCVTCLSYAAADDFCNSHGCHQGMLIR